MRAKLYRNINRFKSYTVPIYINLYTFKVFRNTSALDISDRAIASYFVKSRRSNLCYFKTACFFSSNAKSISRDYLLSRFELKRYAMIGAINGLKVASWLFYIFFLCISFIPLLVYLIFPKILRLGLFLFRSQIRLGLYYFI